MCDDTVYDPTLEALRVAKTGSFNSKFYPKGIGVVGTSSYDIFISSHLCILTIKQVGSENSMSSSPRLSRKIQNTYQ